MHQSRSHPASLTLFLVLDTEDALLAMTPYLFGSGWLRVTPEIGDVYPVKLVFETRGVAQRDWRAGTMQ